MLTRAAAVAAALTFLTVAPAHADDPEPICIESVCTGEVEKPAPPPDPPPVGQPEPQPSQTARPGGPEAQYDVGLPVSAPAGPVVPAGPLPGQLWDDAGVDAVDAAQCDAVPAVACPDAPAAAPVQAAPAAQPQPAVPAPDPVAVAQRSVANLKLKTVEQGSTPLEPGSISIVGVPTWMWAENADALGPVTDTARVPGLSLTMTAKLSSVTWDMGDGTVIECEGTGTEWSPDLGTGDSPTCGHTYTTQGTRTVTSTAHWSVTWRASTGQTGVIDRDLSSTSTIRVGEVQVINSTKGDA